MNISSTKTNIFFINDFLSKNIKNNYFILFCSFLILFLTSANTIANEKISPEQATNWIGRDVSVCGIASSISQAKQSKSKPTFINLGPAFPNHIFTVVIWGNEKTGFSYPLESLKGKYVCVTGKIELFRGIPQIEPRLQKNILVQ